SRGEVQPKREYSPLPLLPATRAVVGCRRCYTRARVANILQQNGAGGRSVQATGLLAGVRLSPPGCPVRLHGLGLLASLLVKNEMPAQVSEFARSSRPTALPPRRD